MAELSPYDSHDLLFAQLDGLLIAASTEETAKQSAIVWRTIRKLIVYKRDCEDALALTARHQETEAGRQGRADFLVKSEGHDH